MGFHKHMKQVLCTDLLKGFKLSNGNNRSQEIDKNSVAFFSFSSQSMVIRAVYDMVSEYPVGHTFTYMDFLFSGQLATDMFILSDGKSMTTYRTKDISN